MSRETRLLLITIGVSVAALLLLARFRFPTQVQILNPSPPPLEQLAARATYDELASIIAQLQARVQPGLVVLNVTRNERQAEAAGVDAAAPQYLPAVRVGDQLALSLLGPGSRIQGLAGSEHAVAVMLAADPVQHLALVRVPKGEAPTWLRERPVAPDVPGYFGIAEGGRGGLTLRPLFVSRLDPVSDPRWDSPLLAMGGHSDAPPGSFIFTLEGALVGMVIDDQGMRMVVPAATLERSVTRLLHGRISAPGDLGVQIQPLSPTLAAATGAEQGVVVSRVDPGGPAASSLKVGDVIQAVDGEPTYSREAFEHWASTIAAGTVATLSLIRQSKPLTASITTRSVPASARPPVAGRTLGLTLRAVPGLGAQVLHVLPQSAGAQAGIVSGDVITTLNAGPLPTPAQVTQAFREAAAGRYVIVGLERAGRPLVVAVAKP